MIEFVSDLAKNQESYTGQERRQSKRVSKALAVVATLVDSHYSPIGERFLTMVSNLSTHGLALIHTREINDSLVAFELPPGDKTKVQVVMRVVRCRAVGRYYEIGGEYVCRFGG
jgi:hypothetical protein